MRVLKYLVAVAAMLVILAMPVYAEDYIVTLRDGVTVEGLTPLVESAGLYLTDKETAEELYSKGLAEDICADEELEVEPVTDSEEVVDSPKLRTMANTYNDPYYSEEVYFEQLKLEEYSATYSPNGKVRIAVIDSGVNREHQELAEANIETGYNYLYDSTDTVDYLGHGTMVTSILVAKGNNNVGGVGICPEATIVPLVIVSKANGEEVSSLAAFVRAIYEAVDNYDCRIITTSIGVNTRTAIMDNAVKYALDKGVIVIAAAGNNGENSNKNTASALCYPASCDGVISVGAIDSDMSLASYSQKNTRVDTVAFGGILRLPSNSGRSSYSRVTGTSFSAPVITGMTALFVSLHPDITPEEYKRILAGGAMDIGELGNGDYMGYGLPDCIAMEKLYNTSDSTYISPIYENGTRNIKVAATDNTRTAMLVCADFKDNMMISYRIQPLYFSGGIAWVSDEGDSTDTRYFVVEDLENLESLSVTEVLG